MAMRRSAACCRRNLGGGIGISIAQAALIERGQVHQSRLTEVLSPLYPSYNQGLDQITQAIGGPDAGTQALGQLYQQVQQQAQMLSFIDVFKAIEIFVICIVPLGLFIRQGKGGGHGAG